MPRIKHQKARSLYRSFERKAPGAKSSHYCPGCGHGTVHNLIAEAIDDLGIQDRTIFCSPVGCSVFGYYYFDVGNIQCAHGRAPAVASAIRRTNPEAIVISYQGDGDLAGIGMSQIVHAANRGENITVFFINNAIYGMTGGQMAPTTLVGQKATTAPGGRDPAQAGLPLKVAEMIAQIPGAAYVERVSVHSPQAVRRAKKAIRNGFRCQLAGRGFSLIEVLSTCPTGWGLPPIEALKWLEDRMIPYYPLGVLKAPEEAL